MVIIKIMGGLGNQLFQYATARNISIKHKMPLKLDTNFYNIPEYNGIFRLNKFNTIRDEANRYEIDLLINENSPSLYSKISKKLNIVSRYNKTTHILEGNHGLKDKRISKCDGNVYLEGWFQHEQYFKDIRTILLKEITLINGLCETNQKILESIKNCESVSLHIRRGDYLNNEYFSELPVQYYYTAIRYILKKVTNPILFIFSDDIPWAKSNLSFEIPMQFMDINSKRISNYHTRYDYEDLILMKNCKHNIIANSSFSWWAAWLNENPNKVIIAPQKWYNNVKAQNYYMKGSLVPPQWIKL